MARHFLSIRDITPEELNRLIERTGELKAGKLTGHPTQALAGKTVGMIFEKQSTRTRTSFEVGIYDLGAHAVLLNPRDTQLGRGETIADTARVLSSYLDGVIIRTSGQERIEEFARHSRVPVINALTDLEHPCQIVSDLFSIREAGVDIAAMKLAYLGDGNNMANTFIGAASLAGFELAIASPEGFEPSPECLEGAGDARVLVTNDPVEAARGADVLYTDVWVSMGQDEAKKDALEPFRPFQLNDALLAVARPRALVMHCLPAHRGEEITPELADGPHSIIFTQAENRLHSGKAIMEMFLSGH